MTVLRARNVTKRFGGLLALSDVDVEVLPGQFVAIIGPNGAGKSTFLNVLTGLIAPTEGVIELDGIDITRKPTYKRVRAGLGRTFQHGRLFTRLSVLDNVMTGAAVGAVGSEAERREISLGLLKDMGLQGVALSPVSVLSYGQRRLVELCRALASNPRVLLLDEPAAGLNTAEVSELMERLKALQGKSRMAMVLIEHNMRMVMGLAERIYVLNFGCRIAEGSADQIQKNPDVLEAYLGRGSTHAGV